MQLVISQVKKQVSDWGPEAKTIQRYSIPEIMSSINGSLVHLYGFIPAEIILGFVLESKVMHLDIQKVTLEVTNRFIEEVIQRDEDKMKERPEKLRIKGLVNRKDK